MGLPLVRSSGPVRSECTMPLPAVIQLTSPGLIGAAVPRLSRCMISPSNQIRDRRESDMRMRTDVEAHAGLELRRAEVIEENERSDHARLDRRQSPPHGKAVAEVDRPRHDDMGQSIATEFVARF